MSDSFQTRFGAQRPWLVALSKLYARVFGWKVEGHIPDDPKFVAIIAPHTSMWDVFLLFILANCFRVRANWLVKADIYNGIRMPLLRWLGGIPVVRHKTQNHVDQVVEILNRHDRMYLALAPEGTRKKTDHWRTGFYWIAHKAKVRIIFMYIDYKEKVMGFGPCLKTTGDINADFQVIRDFYSKVTGLIPKNASDITLKSA